MRSTRIPTLVLILAVAGCGGGGSSDSSPPPPPEGQSLTITLAGTGSLSYEYPSPAVSGLRVLDSLAEYDAFAPPVNAGNEAPRKPPELRALDFTRFSVMYVEGPLDDYLGAVVRLVEIRRYDGTRDAVNAERCTLDPNGIPTPSRAYRPYAFYVIPKLMSTTTYGWSTAVSPGCSTVSQAAATFIAAGEWDVALGGSPPPFGSRAIRTQADLDALLPFFAPGAIPAQYRAPDFSQLTLLFVAGRGDFDANSHVRVDRVLVNDDNSRDVIAEYCGHFLRRLGAPVTHGPFALYAVARYAEDTRFTVIDHVPGSCVLAP